MKFLKALQKTQVKENSGGRASASRASQSEPSYGDKMPELLSDGDLKIGGRNSLLRGQAAVAVNGEQFHSVSKTAAVGLENVSSSAVAQQKQFQSFMIDPDSVNPHLVAITRPHSSYCEEYRSLRTQVLHKSRDQHLQAIVIASVGPGEGKSVTALNLAWLLAQTEGVTSLIIDSDLRMPSLDEYLGIETDTGLSNVLDGEISLQDSIIKLEPSGLHLLTGGRARGDVAELISGARFSEILSEARTMFDYVIIDAPPLGIFTDAAVLINHADAALLVVRANQTRYKDIDRVLESLPRKRLLGTVLNQSEDAIIKNGYYNGYSQYNR